MALPLQFKHDASGFRVSCFMQSCTVWVVRLSRGHQEHWCQSNSREVNYHKAIAHTVQLCIRQVTLVPLASCKYSRLWRAKRTRQLSVSVSLYDILFTGVVKTASRCPEV